MLEVFGSRLELVQSTSPVQGKLCVSVIGPNGTAWPDMFLWDPLSALVHFDEDRLDAMLVQEKRRRSPVVNAVLWISDGGILAAQMLRRAFGGSYGGSLGFGQVGAIVAILSAVMLIAVSVAAFAVIVPLAITSWLLRKHLARQVASERDRVLSRVSEFFVETCASALPAEAEL